VAVKWSELSQRQRAIIGAAAAAELSLKVAALIDIKRLACGPYPRPETRVADGYGGEPARAAFLLPIRPQAQLAAGTRRYSGGHDGRPD
jgi:hypothetical protein